MKKIKEGLKKIYNSIGDWIKRNLPILSKIAEIISTLIIAAGMTIVTFTLGRNARDRDVEKGRREERNSICNRVNAGVDVTFHTNDGHSLTLTKKE